MICSQNFEKLHIKLLILDSFLLHSVKIGYFGSILNFENNSYLGNTSYFYSVLFLSIGPRFWEDFGREAVRILDERPASLRTSRRAAAGRAQLLARRGHTGRVQNPAKVSENRPACGTAQHTLAVCFVFEKLEKSRKQLVKISRKFSNILAKFAKT